MKKTFAVIMAIASLLCMSTAWTNGVNNNLNTISYSSLNTAAKIQVECLAQNIYFEAGHESPKGQMAVALVTLNRAEEYGTPHDICGVVHMRTSFTCQFTWWCDDDLKDKAIHYRYSPKEMQLYRQVRKVALYTYLNYDHIVDVTNGALFYHAVYVDPKWKLRKTVQIGNHIFYRKS